MTESTLNFCDHLNEFVTRSLYTAGQLALLTGIPQRTIANWLQGRVKRPRMVEDVLKVGAALHLREQEISVLLLAAGHPPLPILRQQRPENPLLQPWRPEIPVPFQVGPEIPYFVGRQAEISSVHAALIHSPPQLCLISGMGGVGKTSLAIQLAYLVRDFFSDGVLWANINNANPLTILQSFAAAFGQNVNHLTDLEHRSRAVRTLLADKKVLVILDDVKNSAEITPLLPPTGSAAVLLTTRRHSLSIGRGGHTIHLTPLSIKNALLLTQKLVAPKPISPSQITQLSERVGHLPLALVIAAGRLAHDPFWTVDRLLEILDQHRLRSLRFEEDSVAAAIQVSYELLTAGQQHALAAISSFRGHSFSAAAASAVCSPNGEEHLQVLYSYSLLQFDGKKYQLHPLIHLFANEERLKLPVEKQHQLDQSFAAYFLKILQDNRYDYKTIDHTAAHLTNAVLAALNYPGLFNQLSEAAPVYLNYLHTRGLQGEAAVLADKIFKTARQSNDPHFLTAALGFQSYRSFIQGEHKKARKLVCEGLALATKHSNEKRQVEFWLAAGQMGDVFDEEFILECQIKLKSYLQLRPNTPEALIIHDYFGVALLQEHRLSEARQALHQGLAVSRTLQETDPNIRKLDSLLHLHLGLVELWDGNKTLAADLLDKGVVIAESFGYPPNIATAYSYKSRLAEQQGDIDSAIQYAQEALRIFRNMNFEPAVQALNGRLDQLYETS